MGFLGGGRNVDPAVQEQEQAQYEPQPQDFQPQGQLPPRMGSAFNSDFIRSLYETDDVLMDIECFLRGRVRNQEGGFDVVYQPVASEEGINLLMGDLRMHLHKIGFLSNLSKDDVLRICKECRKMTINWLYLNWYKFKVDKSNLNRIVYNVDHCIFFSCMKSLNDLERGHLFPTTSRTENVMIQNEERKRRWGIF